MPDPDIDKNDIDIVGFSEVMVIGLLIFTNSTRAREDTGELWNNFLKRGLYETIPNKKHENEITAVYTNYEDDDIYEEGNMKKYTYILGAQVTSDSKLPAGMMSTTIIGGTYQHFPAVGNLPESVVQIWEYVRRADLKRIYRSDFEIYNNMFGEGSPDAHIYIGIS